MKQKIFHIKLWDREFPGGPAGRTPHSDCQGRDSIPGQRTKILKAARHSQKQKEKQNQKYPPAGHGPSWRQEIFALKCLHY